MTFHYFPAKQTAALATAACNQLSAHLAAYTSLLEQREVEEVGRLWQAVGAKVVEICICLRYSAAVRPSEAPTLVAAKHLSGAAPCARSTTSAPACCSPASRPSTGWA